MLFLLILGIGLLATGVARLEMDGVLSLQYKTKTKIYVADEGCSSYHQ